MSWLRIVFSPGVIFIGLNGLALLTFFVWALMNKFSGVEPQAPVEIVETIQADPLEESSVAFWLEEDTNNESQRELQPREYTQTARRPILPSYEEVKDTIDLKGLDDPKDFLNSPSSDSSFTPFITSHVDLEKSELGKPKFFYPHSASGNYRTNSNAQVRMIFKQHTGDFSDHDYWESSIGLRYNVSSKLEMSLLADTYFSSGLHERNSKANEGIATVRFSTRYLLGETFVKGWKSSVGLSYETPVSNAAPELTSGMTHLKPHMTFVKTAENNSNLTYYGSVGLDFVSDTGISGLLEQNELTDDSQTIGTGVAWTQGKVLYTLDAEYQTTRLLGEFDEDVISLRPGIMWELPRALSFNSSSKWLLGAGVDLRDGPNGFDMGVSASLRIGMDLERYQYRQNDERFGRL